MEALLDKNNQFDVIVVGSGPGGATVAREMSKRGNRVLILERGGNSPLKDSLLSTVSVIGAVPVGDKLVMGRGLTTGGSTAVYLAATVNPKPETFLPLGIDLSPALAEAEQELPLAPLPDAYLRPQSLKLRESAIALGHRLYTARMLVDQSKVASGYSVDAKWTARNYVHEAIGNGATLVNRARVLRVLVEDGRAVGVEYEVRKSKKEVEVRQAFGSKVIVAAGGAATPVILRNSGIRNVADKGFYCHPGFLVFGTVSGLKAQDGFGATWGLLLENGVHVGDANFNRTFFRTVMLGGRKWVRAFTGHSRTVAMGVMVKDNVGGEMRENGTYHKELAKEDLAKLAEGEAHARRVIEHAGGRDIFRSGISASHLGGTLRIREHVDEKLETEIRNLHVCDGSVLPASVNTPTLSLICLGKYLSKQLERAA